MASSNADEILREDDIGKEGTADSKPDRINEEMTEKSVEDIRVDGVQTEDGSGDAIVQEQNDVAATETTKTSPTHAISSIDVSIPQVEKDEHSHTERNEDNDKDHSESSSDDDEYDTRSVVMGTTKSVTFSVHHNIDDVDAEIARVTMENKTSDDQMSSFDLEVDHYHGGRAATTNTPVTDVITEYPDDVDDKRRTQTPSRENIYEHAISVMRNRSSMTHYTQSQVTIKSNLITPSATSHPPASSATAGAGAAATTVLAKTANGFPIYNLPIVVSKIKEPPFVDCTNCSFYVTQKRTHPVPPVKAWKGYHSNIYFEPMVCRKAELTSPNSKPNKYPQNMIRPTGVKTPESGIELPELVNPPSRTHTAKSTKSVRIAKSAISAKTATMKSRASTSTTVPRSRPLTTATTSRQLAVLDKLSVLDTMDGNIREDIKWIDGMESTGTLQVGEPMRPTGTTTHEYRRSAGKRHYKMRICRGLVSHTLATGQYNNSEPPNGVSGGRMIDSPSKLDYLEQEYQGESHFLSNPHGMFSSPIPAYSLHSSSPLPSLHHRQLSASTIHRPATVNSSIDRKQSVLTGK